MKPSIATAGRPETRAHPPGASGRPVARRRWRRKEILWSVAFIAPALAGLSLFSLWPTIRTVYFSFTEWGAFGGHKWNGIENYRTLLTDPDLLNALRNTLVYTGISFVGIALATMIAALLNQPGLRGVKVYRALYYLPVVTLEASVALMWRSVYNGNDGLLNHLLALVGIHGPHWISNPSIALYAVGAVSVWSSLGYTIVLLLAGMQSIQPDYYEAAEIDGAGPRRQFFSVTIPLLSPTLFFVMVINVIGSLQSFGLMYLMVGQNSNEVIKRTQTLVYLFYERGFAQHNGGYAAAIAVFLFFLIIIFTGLQFSLQRKWVNYD